MKKTIALFMVLLLAMTAFGQQQQEETVVVKKSQLTAQQLAQVEADNMKTKAAQYGEWVGIGKEIGVAVNEGLSAVTTQANNFAQTSVGKWTMFVIIYKVIGRDIIGYLAGFFMVIVGIPVWIWSYRKFLPGKRYLKEEKLDPSNGKVVGRVYAVKDLNYDTSDWLIGHWVILGLFVIVTAFVTFA